jgi:hypothetical protein
VLAATFDIVFFRFLDRREGTTRAEELLSGGRRTWRIPSAAAVRGAARANPRGPAITASRSWAIRVRAGGKRTI